MKVFHQEEPPNPSKRCKFLSSLLKDLFAKRGKLSVSSPESEEPATDFDEEDEVFVSAIISKYMESKSKRKSPIGMNMIDSFKWAISPETGDLKAIEKQGSCGENREEFLSACSRLSRCSSAMSFDAFVSVKTRFSRCSSLSRIDFDQDIFVKRSIIMEFFQCEGWPFGLCRKALLLPPLPKSPADSWSWRKSGRTMKMHV